MKIHEDIACEDGSSLSLETAKLKCEQVLDDMLTDFRQALLTGASPTMEKAWLAFSPNRKPKTLEHALSEVEAGIRLSFLLGIAHAVQLTLRKL